MKKSFLFIPILMVSVLFVSGNLINATAKEFQMKADTIEVRGKIINPCTKQPFVKIRDYNVMGSEFKMYQVNAKGEFNYRIYLTQPKQITLKYGNSQIDFMATTKEKIYSIEITCSNLKDTLVVKGSQENNAFMKLYYQSRTFHDDIDKIAKRNLSSGELFTQFTKVFRDYNSKMNEIATQSPETFTGSVLCEGEKLPESSFTSIDALRNNYFQRAVLSNPSFYYNFLSSRILTNYLIIQDKKDNSFEWINTAMSMALKNQDCAKRLQQIFYDLLYGRHEEKLLVGYQKWVNQHPGGMMNPVVKLQLKNLESCIAGAPLIDIELKDPKGIPKRLSSTASSAKLTLLIFYSPTCEHCQAELPQLVPLWNKYKNKGLKIYAVGFDGTNKEWNDFINTKSSSEWINVFEIAGGASYSSKYVVSQTPAYIFIEPNGKILTRFAQLQDVLKEIPNRLD